MKTNEIFEGVSDALKGFVNIEALTGMLPDVDNANLFQSAVNKIRLGNGSDLNLQEKMQLALGFISLIGLSGPQKSTFIRQLMSIQVSTTPAQAQTNQASPQTSTNSASPA